jgi:hypothetical protein
MSEYKYQNPLENGYKQFYLTKKQHNSLFKYRQIRWFDKYEYYYNDNCLILNRFYNRRSILVSTVLFPVTVLLNGLMNYKECWEDLKKMYNQKEYGSFSGDHISNGTDTYNKIMEMIK